MPTTDAIQRVGRRLRDRNAEIGRAIAERIVDEVPAYREVAPEVLADMLAGSTTAAGLLAGAFAEYRQLDREQTATIRRMSGRRVHQGVTLESYLHAYRAALLAYWDACAQEAAALEVTREEGLALARFAIEAMDLLATQAAEGYVREEAHVRMQSGREARDLVERLVGGQPVDLKRRPPAAPRLDPTAALVTLVGRVEEGDDPPAGDALQEARDIVARHLIVGRTIPLVAVRHGEIVGVIPAAVPDLCARLAAARDEACAARATIDVRFGLSTPCPGFPGVQQGYAEATLAVSYAAAARPVVVLDELSSLECALVDADAPTRAVIAAKGRALLELPAPERAQAAQTIRAFAAADLNVTGAAAALGVHPNTVRYRLARIADASGHDPRTFAGLTELSCILEVIAG